MKTTDIRDKQGGLWAFEVGNFLLLRGGITSYLRGLPGVTNVHRTDRHHCFHFLEFDFRGIRFVVSEDWDDSDRYWIGPSSHTSSEPTEALQRAFKVLPSWWLALRGFCMLAGLGGWLSGGLGSGDPSVPYSIMAAGILGMVLSTPMARFIARRLDLREASGVERS